MSTIDEGDLSFRHLCAVGSALVGVFAAVLQARITAFGLADLAGSFGVGPDEAAWINTVFVVAEVIAIPPAVWLSGAVSIRRIFVPAAGLFAAFSLLAVRATSFEELLVLRALQGLSGGMVIPMAAPTFRRKLPSEERLVGFALYGIAATIPIALAPLCESWTIDRGSVRLFFVVPAVLAAIAAIAGAISFPHYPISRAALRHPDLVGLALPSIGLALVLLGVEQANRLDWHESRWVVGMTVSGLLVLVAFVHHERAHREPAFRLDLLGSRNFTLGLVTYGVFRISLLAIVWAVPDFLVRITGLRPTDFGSVFLALVLPELVLPLVAIRLARRVDPRLLIAVALGFQATACLRMLRLDGGWALPELVPIFLLHGIGQGLFVLPVLTVLSLNIDVPHRSSAVALVNLVRVAGGSVGAAVVGTLLTRAEHLHQNRLNEHLAANAAPAIARLADTAERLALRAPGDPVATALGLARGIVRREAFVLAYADVLLVIGALVVGCIALQAFVRPVSLDELRRPPSHDS